MMEKHLLVGVGGGGESSRRTTDGDVHDRGLLSPLRFQRRTNAIAYGSVYQKAAALVDLAEDGIGLPEQVLEDSRFENAVQVYFWFIRFDILWSLNLYALITLNFLEKPLWCAKSTHTCNDREYFFLGQLPYLTTVEALVYEGITLSILILHTFFPLLYEGYQVFSKNPLNKLKIISLLLLIADLLVYALYLSPIPINSLPLRIAPYIRVVLLILNIRNLLAGVVTAWGMLGTYLNALALWLLFLLFSSWLAYVIFEDTQQGKTFYSYEVTLYQMFGLFTATNNPDVWIPAYKESRWYSLFFILYVLLGVYFLSLILGVVYDSFKSQLAKQVARTDLIRNRVLSKAFMLIDTDGSGFLRIEQCIRLFEELNKYRSLPNISREEFEPIFHELDDTGDFKITPNEFADLCYAIGLRFKKEDIPSWFENYPSIYHSYFSEKFKDFVRSATFGYIISFILMLNLVAVVIETKLDGENNSAQKVWRTIEFIFGWIYVLEMAFRIFSYGFENYWKEGQNRFDFVVTWIIVIGETATFALPGVPFLSNGEWIWYLLIARMLRLIRLLMHIERYKVVVRTFFTLIPTLMPYLGTIFCVLCIYCSLGLQIFGGIVNSGNPKLAESLLSKNDYLLFNFNDYPSGMVTLYNMLVMGNAQIWMQAYTELTGTSWTLVYFISFYLLTVLLLLNVVVAFILEAFFTEVNLDKGGSQIVGPSQRGDRLLHQILSGKLNESQGSRV